MNCPHRGVCYRRYCSCNERVCNDCAISQCWECGTNGPFCKECFPCKNKDCDAQPGVMAFCETCNTKIYNPEDGTKCDICDEFMHHKECLHLCKCGREDEHYVCKGSDRHNCAAELCYNPVCSGGIVETPFSILLVCHRHFNKLIKWAEELVEPKRKKIKN